MDESADHIDPTDIVEVLDIDEHANEGDVAEYFDEIDIDDDSYDDSPQTAVRDDAVDVFRKHQGSVFCVCTDPVSSGLALSGSEDDHAYLWSTSDAKNLLTCTGHKDSVTCAGFSYDSLYAATGDMTGLIKVWSVTNKDEVCTLECGCDLEWMSWHHSSHVLLAGTNDGDVWMWRVPGGECKMLQSHGSTCTAGKILPNGKRIVAGYNDGSVKIWDLKNTTAIHSFTGHDGHSSTVACLDCHSDNVLVMTGSTDVTAKILNVNTGKVVTTFNCNKDGTGPEEASVESVGFSKTNSLAATGTLNGYLTIWDVPKQIARHVCKHEAGIVKLVWDVSSPLVYTCTLDGAVHLWDIRSGSCECQWFGHVAEILDFDVTRDGHRLVTSSGDGTCRVFSLMPADR